MADVPTPRSWTVGEVVTALKLNGIRDALRFLLSGTPLLVLRQTAVQTIYFSQWSKLAFQTEGADTDGMFDAGIDATQVSVQTPGWYRVTAVLAVDPSAAAVNSGSETAQTRGGALSADPNRNWGCTVAVAIGGDYALMNSSGAGWGTGVQTFQASGLVYLNAGDTLSVWAVSDAGIYDGTLKTAAAQVGFDGSVCRLELQWVSS